MIELRGVGYRLDTCPILQNVGFSVGEGELFGIIGPNGSGKSTLLKLISGTERLTDGEIIIAGRSVASYGRKEMARMLAVLQQEGLPPLGFTVREVVEMGRYPYQNWFGDEATDQDALLNNIMTRLDLNMLAHRTLEQLSGGERQRVALAKTMAQQPRVLLLDEPTTYLDIGYQLQMMDYVRGWQQESKLTVIAVLHDLNLAALYCDRLLVLNGGEGWAIGKPDEVLQEQLVQQVYGTRPLMIRHPSEDVTQVLLRPSMLEMTDIGKGTNGIRK